MYTDIVQSQRNNASNRTDRLKPSVSETTSWCSILSNTNLQKKNSTHLNYVNLAFWAHKSRILDVPFNNNDDAIHRRRCRQQGHRDRSRPGRCEGSCRWLRPEVRHRNQVASIPGCRGAPRVFVPTCTCMYMHMYMYINDIHVCS